MTRPAKKLDELVTFTVPRSALTMVAAAPLTVTQRTCFDLFGISPRDYKKLATRGAFPHKRVGQLRIARYSDVAAYLTDGVAGVAERRTTPGPKRPALDPLSLLTKAGAVRRTG